jgi:hypothetical protein
MGIIRRKPRYMPQYNWYESINSIKKKYFGFNSLVNNKPNRIAKGIGNLGIVCACPI